MEQDGWPLSLSVSRGQRDIIRYVLKGILLGLALLWLAPLVSITVTGAMVHRDSTLTATAFLSRIPEALGRVSIGRLADCFLGRFDFLDGFAERVEDSLQFLSTLPRRKAVDERC